MIVDPDFCDHWKTRLLVGELGGDEAAPVYVLRLWAHCQNRRKSVFDNLTPEALKALCRFPGQANKLESSLAASGFIRRNEEKQIEVIGWNEYNASLIAAWENGKQGGRPPEKPRGKPTGYPNGKPTGKPTGSRAEKSREDYVTLRAEPNRSEEILGQSQMGVRLAEKLRPKDSRDMQFLTLVGRAVDERHIAESLVASALVGCDSPNVRKPIGMFRVSLRGNVQAAGGDLESILQSLTTGGDDANEAS